MEMNNDIEYVTIIQKIESIYDDIRKEGTNLRKRYLFAFLTSIVNVISIILLTYFVWNKDIHTNTYSLLIGVINLLTILLFAIFIQREDNKLYRYYNIPLQKPIWKSFQPLAQRKLQQIITNKFENTLLSAKLLFCSYEDIRLIDSYISTFRRNINEKYFEPLVLTGRVSILVFLFNIGVDIVRGLSQGSEINFRLILFFVLLLVVVIISIYVGVFILGKFYMEIKNRRVNKFSRICDYLDAIRLKRIFEDINSKRNTPPPTLIQRIKNVFC